MMKTYATGWDFGHKEIDCVMSVKGKTVRLTMPTAFKRVESSAFGASLMGEGMEIAEEKGKGKVKTKGKMVNSASYVSQQETDPMMPSAPIEPEKVIIRLHGEPPSTAYAVGHYALEQTNAPWNGKGDYLRYASSYALKGLLASSALMQAEREYGLLVVAGVPAEFFTEHKDLPGAIKKKLDGIHVFTLDGETWYTAHITVVAVVMEGAGALLAYRDRELTLHSEAGVIDIGGGTTDLYAQRGVKPLDDLCKGKDIAVDNATTLMKTSFLQKYKRSLTDREARDSMRAFGSGKKQNFPPLFANGTAVPIDVLQDMVEQAVDVIAEDIVSFVSATWGSAISRFSPVLLVGGGTFYFYAAVKNRIDHITLSDDPVFANALGYATLAARKLAKLTQEAVVAAEKATVAVGE